MNRGDLALIDRIAHRAVELYIALGMLQPRQSRFFHAQLATELTAVHRDVVPLRLHDMLGADAADFAHDVAGIHRHVVLARSYPARLGECFMPRFAETGKLL